MISVANRKSGFFDIFAVKGESLILSKAGSRSFVV